MRTIVVMPTYNEADNLEGMAQRLRTSCPGVHLLVVDDDSPDGTGTLADGLALDDSSVHVLHRTQKEGLGAAYRAGFAWALDAGFEAIVEMDADGSHQPEQLPAMLEAAESADVVIGSRWVTGGEVVGWPLRRSLLSRGGSLYARVALGLGQRDVTGGYRVYRADALRVAEYDTVESQGYSFQIEMLWRCADAGLRIAEVPITFREREFGASKMSGRIVVEAVVRVAFWAITPVSPRRGERVPARTATASTTALDARGGNLSA